MILVDTSVWIDYFCGKSCPAGDQLDLLLGQELVAIGDLMLAEVLQGFRNDNEFRTARELLLRLEIVNLVDAAIALQSAEHYRYLRRLGLTVRKKTNCIIATWCIKNSVSLLQSDRDFLPFHDHLGLQLI